MLQKIAALALSLASLVLGDTITVAGVPVRRASLFGYQVGGAVLDLEDAARVLANAPAPVAGAFAAAHHKTCDWIGCPGCKIVEPPADLLIAPHETFHGHRAETWRKGAAADRRIRQLRRALRVVTTRSGTRTARLTAELGAERATIETVEISYTASSRVPPIAAA